MHARRSILDSPHVKQSASEIDLVPPQRAQLTSAQTVPVSNQDDRRVAVPVAPAIARAIHQQPNFLDSEVFALTPPAIG